MILQGDCLDILPTIGDNSVNLIYTDPPYFKVKSEAWDRQWDKPAQFLGWLGEVLEEFRRVLAPNGSLYLFASPKMAARVELKVGEYFEVLNNIRWVKSEGWHKKSRKEDLRSFLSPWESVIFAEHFGAANRSILGDAIYRARSKAGMKGTDVDIALGHVRTRDATRGTELCRRWEEGSSIPSEDDFISVMKLCGINADYEDLRREYEDLRRPFTVSSEVPYTDVWNYPTVQSYPGKHPTEKPFQMHIDVINASSRPGDTVLDAFGGSCKVYDVCLELGRVPIIIEKDEGYYRAAMKRIRNKPTTLEKAMAAAERPPATLEDFAP